MTALLPNERRDEMDVDRVRGLGRGSWGKDPMLLSTPAKTVSAVKKEDRARKT